jgi:ribosomal protein S18 acetylase RimI-like enzyme
LTDWTIRLGTRDDLRSVLDLWREAESLPTVTDDFDSLVALLDADPGSLLVAESGGVLVGSLIAAWDGWRGSFYRLAVRPGQRRRGLATALLREGEGRLRRRGAVRIDAIVADAEAEAMSFWPAVGYERQAGRARFVRNFESSAG